MPESEYEVELFRKQGFTRQTCSKCSTPFWSLGIHETCGEAPCQEYDFIGASPFKKKLTYRAMREDFLSFLEQNGHTRVKRYPIVARWRDDVFFVQASVYPFQPWVISGEASPPANPLAISQPCVRFLDIDNVGKTGQHFTMFEMMAHHAFNFPKKFIYFKDRTVEICHLFLAERVGVSVDELVAQVSPLEALYTVCDHSRALIFLLGDGVVPSNSREGYFARLLVRRGLRALKDLNITYSLADTVSFMIDQIREDHPEFFFNKGDIMKLLKVEEARYKETLEKGRATVGKIATELTAAGRGS